MPFPEGAPLGPYEILGPLGAGGMGEVYRARDTKLGREVAIETLPGGFSRDPERLVRFQREAQVLAFLNHPNIAAIYHGPDPRRCAARRRRRFLVNANAAEEQVQSLTVVLNGAAGVTK